MNMTPKCLHCGAEMELGTPSCNPNSIHWCYVCGCGAQGPICDTKEAALSAALRRYVEPNRALTLEELLDFCDTHGYIEPIFLVGKGAISISTGWAWAGAVKNDLLMLEQYIKGYPDEWEAYIRRPTDEERQSAAWGGITDGATD